MYDVFYIDRKPDLFAHEKKVYSLEQAVKQSKTQYFWLLHGNNDYTGFNFDWEPDKWESQQIHVFPDQWCRNSETYFINKDCIGDGVDINFRNECGVTRKENIVTGWRLPRDVKMETVDRSWHPDPMDPPYIYEFPTKYQKASGVQYHVEGATEKKYVNAFTVEHFREPDRFIVPPDVDVDSIDFTWRPNPYDPPYCYQFPTKFQKASGVVYCVEAGAPNRYTSDFTVRHTNSRSDNWKIPDDMEFVDLSWRPDPLDPPYIYKFASEYARESGLEYHVPGATKYKYVNDISVTFNAEAIPRYYIETTIEDLIAEHKDEVFWALNKEMDYDRFDFSWRPDISQRDYLHVFGSQWTKHAQTFYVDAASLPADYKYNFVQSQTVRANSNIDIFYVDKYNSGADDGYKELSIRFESCTRIRFVKDMLSTIQRAAKKAKTDRFWVVSSENDYSDFNFDWHAEPWQNYMLHVFGSDEQKWSDTFLINKTPFEQDANWAKSIEEMPNLNFVTDQKVKAVNVNDIYMVDFGQQEKLKMVQHNKLEMAQHNKLKTTRFVDSYLSVIKRLTAHSTSEYIWVTSNICDYSNFNFDWRPEPYQAKMLHVFGQENNKFGDTFLVHVPTFKEQSDKLELLDWYETVNYCKEQYVPRLPYDQVEYTGDDLTSVIKAHTFDSPYAMFYPKGTDVSTIDYNPSVWRLDDRAIHTFNESGSVVLAPRDTLQYLDTQCYDYPQIMKQKTHFLYEKPLNIVFISNGETMADTMYERLLEVTAHDDSLTVKRVDGVHGRAAAYKAAAEISDTDWAFNVFAKLEVDADFDWHWQPDRLQEPKHYIFHALNPINGLEYGHQGIIAYNKKLVLETDDWGLDFTLSRAHETVPVRSGIARIEDDPWIVWRTAFRETIKLLNEGDKVSRERLQAWFHGKEGKYGYMSVNGSADAARYYREVKGDMDKLLLTFEWQWLKDYYDQYYWDLP